MTMSVCSVAQLFVMCWRIIAVACPYLRPLTVLMMEAVYTSVTFVSLQQITQRSIPEDTCLYTRKNPKLFENI
jgi:hypothetical protein